jgi:signal transduction histidine kinase
MTTEATPPPGRVLVVDDNNTARYTLSLNVTKLGHKPVQAANGKEALDKLRAEAYDLVLLDIEMPEMDGFAALQEIKKDASLHEIPVVMVSGNEETESVVKCIQAGAEDYITKPPNPDVLRARVNTCLEKKRLRDQQREKTEELERTLAKLKSTQEQLVAQEKLASLGALTAGIAHEIKNPLNFVNNLAEGSVKLAQELGEVIEKEKAKIDPGAADEVADLLGLLQQSAGKIHENGRRAVGIVNGMLDTSRGGKGERRSTDINALLKEFVNIAYHGLRGQDMAFNIDLQFELDPSLKPINVVPQDLSRVFLNIANNGCYAAHQRKKKEPGHAPKLTARTKDLGDKIEIRIRDNGEGIPAAIREKILEPFFTTKPTGSGTGLGLSISRDIVVGHRGELRLETEEGSGTEFIVTLPKDG